MGEDEIRKILFDIIPDLPLLRLTSSFGRDHDGHPILVISAVVDDSYEMEWEKYFAIKRKLRNWLEGEAFPVLTFYPESEAKKIGKEMDWRVDFED